MSLEKINQAGQQASEDIYKAQQSQPNQGQQPNGDNVQDVDFEEVK